MSDPGEKLGPTITAFGAGMTKGKIAGGAVEVEETIAVIIGGWKHLVGAGLERALEDFGAKTRASAQLIVTWNADFTAVMDFLIAIGVLDEKGKDRDFMREGLRRKGTKGVQGVKFVKG
jgi:hypothetical protein